MGTQNFIGQLAFVVSPWFLAIMNSGKFFRNEDGDPDQVAGAFGLAVVIGIVTIALGILPAIFLRERMAGLAAAEGAAGARSGLVKNMERFLTGFLTTLKSGPFLKLCATAFLVFNGFMLIASFQFYVIIYYVMGGDEIAGAKWAGLAGTVGAVANFAIVAFLAWLGTRIGKRHTLLLAIAISVLGYALKWVCYNPDIPWLVLIPAPLIAFGMGGLWTLIPSMIADVVDLDELETSLRREGMYGSIFWWTIKLGMAAALALSGYLLNATGFDVDLGAAQNASTLFLMRLADIGVPVLTSALALWAVYKFPITEQRAYEVRAELERRRGKAGEA
jgi:GPH family glycoside/pentoside/hexuronide:cation symporter